MNPYAVAIVLVLVAEHALGLVADLLNRRALTPEVPAEFADAVDGETYARSQEYARVRAGFGRVVSAVALAALLAFWGLGGFAWVDGLFAELSPVPRGLAFFGTLVLLRSLLTLPVSWWSTFRIEERFGFNRTTPATFWADKAKSLLVTALVGAPLLGAALWLFTVLEPRWTPALLWIPVGILVLVLGLQVLGTTVILPLFLRFRPLEEGDAREALLACARSVGFPAADVHVVDGSRRSTKANAFFTGLGRTRRIALFDTLIERHPLPELLGVVAHELGHWKHRHVWQGTALGTAQLTLFAGLFLLALLEPRLPAALGVEGGGVHVALVAFGLLLTPLEVGIGLASNALSRRNEFQADAFAARTTGDPEALVSGLKRLSVDSLSNLTPHPFYVALHHGHPPVLDRIAALRAGR